MHCGLTQSGRYDEAVIRYLWLAELGVEVAQHNAAHILEKGMIFESYLPDGFY